MTNEQYRQLTDQYKGKVSFVWSHWIDKSIHYSEAEDFCRQELKQDAQITATAIANLPHNK